MELVPNEGKNRKYLIIKFTGKYLNKTAKATLIKEMFYDLELEEECADIFDKFPWVISAEMKLGLEIE